MPEVHRHISYQKKPELNLGWTRKGKKALKAEMGRMARKWHKKAAMSINGEMPELPGLKDELIHVEVENWRNRTSTGSVGVTETSQALETPEAIS